MAGKRAANGSGHIRQRKENLWEGIYTVGRDPSTGKLIKKSVYGKTEAEVARKLRKITASVDDGIYTEPSKLTLGGWLDIYLSEYTGNLKERTFNLYQGYANKIKASIGAVRLPALTAPVIQSFYNGLTKGEGAVSPKTVANIHGTLRKALQTAVTIGYLPNNPAAACTLPRRVKPQIKPLDKADIDRFIEAIQGHRFETFYIVDMFTGLRQGEILGLTWDCIDFKTGTITVYRQLQLIKGIYSFTTLKNDKVRKIAPAQLVMQLLYEQRRNQLEWRLKAGKLWVNNDFVFTNEIGENLARQTIYHDFKTIMASIGLPDARFHDLRHTYAVAALRAGDDIKTVQENLGHHTAAFTMDTYMHVTDSMKKESSKRMDAFINSLNITKQNN